MRATWLALSSSYVLAALGVSGCGPSCPEGGGPGTIELTATGLPAGIDASVSVTGPGGAGAELGGPVTSLAAGEYTVSPRVVAGAAHPTVRLAYAGAATPATVCVAPGRPVALAVAYSPIPTSGKLWTPNGSGGTTAMQAYDTSVLTESGSPSPTYEADTRDAAAATVDREGNLWLVGGTTADPTLNKYLAGTIATAVRAAAVELAVTDSGCLPAARDLAFDRDGNLWVAVLCEDRVVKVDASALTYSGSFTPAVSLRGLNAPAGLAFDAAGNLWVADDSGAAGTLHMFTPAQLAGGAASPAQSIVLGGTGAANPNANVDDIAFDAAGNAWLNVGSNYNFAKLNAGDLAGTGRRTVTPAAYLSVGVTALPHRPALDDSGGLWFGLGAGTLARLGPAQLGTNSTDSGPSTPEVVLTPPELGYPGGVFFYPAAAGLPLPHALP